MVNVIKHARWTTHQRQCVDGIGAVIQDVVDFEHHALIDIKALPSDFRTALASRAFTKRSPPTGFANADMRQYAAQTGHSSSYTSRISRRLSAM